MRECPKCGYIDPPYWRPAKMHNPSGDTDIARIDDIQFNDKQLAEKILAERGEVIVVDSFAYLLGKRAVWVKRIAARTYRNCGKAAFKPPRETSKHNPLANKVSGRTKTTFRKQRVEGKRENKNR